jgi:hypothetical protein
MVDKILISNNSALSKKYGTGLQTVQAAIARLIAADQARGLQTIYIAVDDPVAMTGVNGTPVTNTADPKENKAAVDAIYSFHAPQYVVLVGAVDVIPHQDLSNPAYNPARPADDPDQSVPSDLPYACAAPYSNAPGDFVAPSRVVSRLPDVTGASNATYLVHVLDLASGAAPLTQADYADYLGVSASVWNPSTALSLGAVFSSSAAMQSVLPAGYQWPLNRLALRAHFFNCHGASNTPQYFGQTGQQFPVAQDAAYISGRLTPGTVASVECCYGAQLYDPNGPANGQMAIANVYMDGGAYGFWGSTTIAYGPATSNANADLICQYFLKEVFNGASIGRAALGARLSFVNNSAAISPVDLKTLAQFILLGDASIQCVPLPDAGKETATKYAITNLSGSASERLSRMERRQGLAQLAAVLQTTKAVAEKIPDGITPAVQAKLAAIRAAAGMQDAGVLSFRVLQNTEAKAVTGRATIPPTVKEPTAFHLLTERTNASEQRVTLLRVIEVTEADGDFIRVRELFSR